MSDGGKGSAPRPLSVSKEDFDNNFHKIFGQLPSKHCDTCGKLPSWCACGKQFDVEATVKKTWEF